MTRALMMEDHKPIMDFIYEAINKAREEMHKRSKRKKRVEPYLKILDSQ